MMQNPDNVDAAGEAFRELAAAYEILSNPESRKEYDGQRGRPADRTEWTPKASKAGRPFKAARRRAEGVRQPPGGIDPEWGRQVDVDLSRERMEKAWAAYKIRWAREEEAMRMMQEKKLVGTRKE